MTDRKKLDDSQLLDLIMENRDAEGLSDLDADSRSRLEELRRVHDALRSVARDENRATDAGLSEASLAAVVRRVEGAGVAGEVSAPAHAPENRQASVPRGSQARGSQARGRDRTRVIPLRPRRWRPVAMAAAVLILAAVAWSAFGPSGATRAVEAAVFGGLELIRGGETVVTPVNHRIRIRPGDVILSHGGGELDIGAGYFLKIGQNARLACLQLSERSVVLGLESGRLRCESIEPDKAQLTIHVGNDLTLKARTGTIFALQWMGQPDDQIEVDHGIVTIQRAGRRGQPEQVSVDTGPYSLHEQCVGTELSDDKKAELEPCHRRGKRPEVRPTFPTQTDLSRALSLARRFHSPILVTREDGPDISPCYKSCCFVDFVAKRRGLGGVVWLVLDPKKQAKALARFNLTDDRNGVVVLNDRGEVMDRGHIESDDGMYAAVLNLIRSGRSKCKD